MPDRSVSPKIFPIENLILPAPDILRLDNGIPVYVTNMGTQEAIKLELVFGAGRPFERHPLAGRATAGLLKEGTRHHSSAELAEIMDFYGASISFPFNLDTANIVLYSLGRYFEKVMPLVTEMLAEPVFPPEELDNFVRRNQQLLLEDLTKTDVVAYRTITELIFGADHPYGYNSSTEIYRSLQREHLVEHYQRCYTADNCQVFISGKIGDDILETLNRYLGQWDRQGRPLPVDLTVGDQIPGPVRIPMPDTVQTAIRIGRRLFNRHHPDYPAFYVLNNILGGYFGSRLMANIREEKGYTYNIYSTADAMRYDGYFYIGTEVGNEFVGATLEQIYLEMGELGREPVSGEEMEMVRNYLMGSFLSNLDGPFNVSELIRTLVTEDLPLSYFDDMVRTVQTVTPEELMLLARQYLRSDEMWEVIVGSA